MINLTLPHPPSANTYYRRSGHHIHISDKGRDFAQAVRNAVLVQIGQPSALDGRLSLSVTLCAPDRRKRDIDNSLKPLLDALTKAGVWIDDSQVDELIVRRGDVAKGGVCFVVVKPLTSKPANNTLD